MKHTEAFKNYKRYNPAKFEELRVKAIAKLDQVIAEVPAAVTAKVLLHELRVHQIELEMQNEELQDANQQLELMRNRYLDLYEFSPVGFMTLADDNFISVCNLKVCSLLGMERRALLHSRFAILIADDDKDRWYQFSRDMKKSPQGEEKSIDLVVKRSNGTSFYARLNCLRLDDKTDAPDLLRLVLTDVSQQKQAEEEVEHLAFYDPLTSLPNRRLMLDRLNQIMLASTRTGHAGALLFIDIDNFKTLNDTLGHDAGDLLLQQMAQRLAASVRAGDTVSRQGGDEFVVILDKLSEQPAEAAKETKIIADKILTALRQSYQLANHTYLTSVSIGATLFNTQEIVIDDLLKQADLAMYEAKAAGRNTFRFFNPHMQESINAHAKLVDNLHVAFEQQQFQLHYQTQVDCVGLPVGAEALIRWKTNTGLLTPFSFLALAEETGLILAIGDWVIDSACAQLKLWQQHPLTRDITLSVNVSAKQFKHSDFVQKVQEAVLKHDINPVLLRLELTESLVVGDVESLIPGMNALKNIGVRFILDDFGTGYSSIQYLKKLPLECLKIDQSFVRDIVTDTDSQAIVSTIISMANHLGIDVMAEGVETEAQRQYLLSKGCKNFQGYLFGLPLPIDAYQASLKKASWLDDIKRLCCQWVH
jgi:diguanylate cyclase (GGDEF)-like protein/PAS domain S-box-containing protein